MPVERIKGIVTDSNARGICVQVGQDEPRWFNWSNYCRTRPAEELPAGSEVQLAAGGDWIREFQLLKMGEPAPAPAARPGRRAAAGTPRAAEDRNSINRIAALKAAIDFTIAHRSTGTYVIEDVLEAADEILAWINKQ